MKILYITNGYPPLNTAGTENYTAGIASTFAKAGHDVQVICAGEWDNGSQPINIVSTSRHEGVTVTRLSMNWMRGPDPNRYLYDNPLTASHVEDVLSEFRPDVVHITSCYTLSASVIRPIKRLGFPLIITLTDFWFLCPRVSLLRSDGQVCDGRTSEITCLRCMMHDSSLYQRISPFMPRALKGFLLKQASRQAVISRQRGFRGLALDMADRKATVMTLLREADVLIAPSQSLADVFTANDLAKSIRVEGYGHPLDWVRVGERLAPAAKVVFGYVGRITHAKGVHVLVEAILRLGPSAPAMALVWGDTMQEPDYAVTVMATASPQVSFKGKFQREQLAEVFGQIDVLVVPSLWRENNPLVIQEAFVAGIPVIASNLGGMAEFVSNDVNGLLFEAGNSEELARQLQRFLHEPGLWQRLQAGIPPVKPLEEELEVLAAIYRDAVSARTRTAEVSPA